MLAVLEGLVERGLEKMTKLKPCPFCGCEAELRKTVGMYHVRCKACGENTVLVESEKVAAMFWNRRTGEKPLNELAAKIHKNAVEHGWWEEERSFGDIISLCHSELSEALEEDRNGKPLEYYLEGKPEGVAVEMIDCIIRILDWCGKEKVDVDRLLRLKHEYNVTRPHKHGGKKY